MLAAPGSKSSFSAMTESFLVLFAISGIASLQVFYDISSSYFSVLIFVLIYCILRYNSSQATMVERTELLNSFWDYLYLWTISLPPDITDANLCERFRNLLTKFQPAFSKLDPPLTEHDWMEFFEGKLSVYAGTKGKYSKVSTSESQSSTDATKALSAGFSAFNNPNRDDDEEEKKKKPTSSGSSKAQCEEDNLVINFFKFVINAFKKTKHQPSTSSSILYKYRVKYLALDDIQGDDYLQLIVEVMFDMHKYENIDRITENQLRDNIKIRTFREEMKEEEPRTIKQCLDILLNKQVVYRNTKDNIQYYTLSRSADIAVGLV